MPGEARRLLFLLCLAYLVVALDLGVIQFVFRGRLANHPYNPRLQAPDPSVVRGGILARSGEVITAGPLPERRYPVPSLCHTVGYATERLGTSGLEAACNEILTGRDPRAVLANWGAAWHGGEGRGGDVITTIDLRLQRAAARVFGPRRGAMVILDAASGDVLALISRPEFRNPPTPETWRADRRRTDAPFLPRVVAGLYPPGSTFKIVVAAAALAEGLEKREEFCRGETLVGGRWFKDARSGGHGLLTLHRALAVSCNVYFTRLGVRLGAGKILRWARAFGLAEAPPFTLPTEAGRVPSPVDSAETAAMAIGQGRLLVTPLQMALVAAAVVNDGLIMQPRLVRAVRFVDGGERRFPVRPWRRVLSPAIAELLRRDLEEAVAHGTGYRAAVPGWIVGGKTGTAQAPGGAPHAWFVGFARVGQRRLALAVVVEHGGGGGEVAAPIVAAVLKAVGGEGA
ncbi:MAG: penicillin-binding protein 2 [Firmicutes bacterium]|nr:penicillin-binding protein 2 [Bacillota bacterium]